MTKKEHKIIVGVTGASGFVLAECFLHILKTLGFESHLVMTKAAQITRQQESKISLQDLKKLADVYHPIEDVGASIASGSFIHQGMVILPCSMNTVAELAHGLSSNLLTRAADVCLKEQRKLIIAPRETPLHRLHLKNLLTLAELGAIIMPPMPAFYQHPKSIEEMIEQFCGRILSTLGISNELCPEWQGWRQA
jgi:4-hydroxy-3-polyprenylbenzoate decarboxylase